MGFEVWLSRFVDGSEAKIDEGRLREMLRELTVHVNGEFSTLRAADDSEAEVYDPTDEGCSFADSTGGEIDAFMIRVARELDCVLLPSYGPVMLTDEAQRDHLPERFAEDAVLVASVEDFDEAMAVESLDEDE
jgi:hypothetical protein